MNVNCVRLKTRWIENKMYLAFFFKKVSLNHMSINIRKCQRAWFFNSYYCIIWIPFIKVKCYQYWPNDGKTEMYRTVTVKSMEEKLYAFFTKRKLEVSQEGVKIITKDNILFNYSWNRYVDKNCFVFFGSLRIQSVSSVLHEHYTNCN